MNEHASIKSPFENIEAEQQLLGAILLQNSIYDLVSDILGKDHFRDPLHARIFELCGNRITKGHLVSPVALAPILADDEGLAQVGGPAYLVRMAGASAHARFARDYAKIIIETDIRRRLAEASAEAASRLRSGSESGDVKAGLLTALHSLPETLGDESSVSLLKAVTKSVANAVEAYQGKASYLKTGVTALDNVLKGLGAGDVMLLGGATSMGKTSLALEIAANVSIGQGLPVGFWSLEMSDDQLAARMASARSRVPYAALRDAATMDQDDFRKWVEASNEISQAPLRIIPKHIRDIAAGHAAMRRVKREFAGKLSLAIVDYAQLIRGSGKSRFEQMTEVSIGLKTLAGMLECPLIALVQLSRNIGERDDKRPQLFDIKETGQFENDADQVVFCHREGYWLERQGPKLDKSGHVTDSAKLEWEADVSAVKNVMELIVRKNRHGRLATAQVGFHDATNRFWSLDRHDDVREDEF
jgi:replicative DNA helicase